MHTVIQSSVTKDVPNGT